MRASLLQERGKTHDLLIGFGFALALIALGFTLGTRFIGWRIDCSMTDTRRAP